MFVADILKGELASGKEEKRRGKRKENFTMLTLDSSSYR